MPANSPTTDRARLVAEANREKFFYHTIRAGQGLVLEGLYDMDRYLPFYRLPEDLSGRKCLDIGTANGYWAFEMERRGAAEVTAIDILGRDTFEVGAQLLDSGVRYFKKSIYELGPSFGSYDFIVCGSLLLHLSDFFGALERIRSVCRGQAVLSTLITEHKKSEKHPFALFVGEKQDSPYGEYWTYWAPNLAAFTAMTEKAGFSRVEVVARFDLESEPGRMAGGPAERAFATPHAVLHASV